MEEAHEATNSDSDSSLEDRILEKPDSSQNGESAERYESYLSESNRYSANNNKLISSAGKPAPAKSEAEKPAIERTNDGAVALIYYQDERTGKVEMLFEQRPANDSEAGKLSLIGGAVDIVDGRREGSLETLMRELDEEISDASPRAKSIIRNTLNATRDLYAVVSDDVGGETAFTYVYKIQIQSAREWDIVKRAYLADDAGNARVLSARNLESFAKKDFAFSFGETILQFVSKNKPQTALHFSSNTAGYSDKTQPISEFTAENYKFNNSGILAFLKPSTDFPSNPPAYSMQYRMAA